MWRIMLAVVAGLAISVGLDTGPSATHESGEVQLALGNKYSHCKPSCGSHMACHCEYRDCYGIPCVPYCYCVPK